MHESCQLPVLLLNRFALAGPGRIELVEAGRGPVYHDRHQNDHRYAEDRQAVALSSSARFTAVLSMRLATVGIPKATGNNLRAIRPPDVGDEKGRTGFVSRRLARIATVSRSPATAVFRAIGVGRAIP